ncbi:DUF4321 domain-containing protein [Oscillospiraceae bacterium OttesenSCG-928-G22]|nr:DUF4321 domain-containing protein [Oscillospiraceae bacterium OttesenSCG-928-G22]
MKSKGLLTFLLIAGGALGTLVGELCLKVPFLSWLGYSMNFGLSLSEPLYLDLMFFQLRFGFAFHLSIATILFLFLTLVLYRRFA